MEDPVSIKEESHSICRKFSDQHKPLLHSMFSTDTDRCGNKTILNQVLVAQQFKVKNKQQMSQSHDFKYSEAPLWHHPVLFLAIFPVSHLDNKD